MVRQFVFLVALAATSARADDAVLERLLEQAKAASPEVAQARAAAQAEGSRVPQASALPDPTLSLGLQNDSFTRFAVGEMGTSFWSIGLTQPLPWPGKRGLRGQVASLEQKRAQAQLSRAELTVEGQVRRAYLALLLARGERALLEEQERLWAQAEGAASSRYEAGQAPQSDLLRAQLEQARLEQRGWALEAETATRVAELNRLRAHPLDEPIDPGVPLAELPDPALPSPDQALRDALDRSPEVQLASASVTQADRRVDLARRERFPDFALSATVMPRGRLEPMWAVGLSVGLPIFGTQARAVTESEQRQVSESQGAEAVRQVVALRARERLSVLAALNRTNRHYRKQLLVLSEATARSALSQYEVGRLPFAAVLEALSGYVSDRTSYLSSLAEAQLVEVAQKEVSLDPVPSLAGAPSAAAMPGTSAMPAAASAATPGAGGAEAAASSTPRGMGGM